MKKIYYSLLLSAALLAITVTTQAAVLYVTPNGTGNGKAWNSAIPSIKSAISSAQKGDTVKVAAGVWNEQIVIKDGVSVKGGFDAATGKRDIEKNQTIIDGTGLETYILIKYDTPCSTPTYIDGLTFRNAQHTQSYGCGYLRKNVIVQNCTITACAGSKIGAFYNEGGIIRNCVIELCSAGDDATVRNYGGLIQNTIFRGNQGKFGAAVYNENGGRMENCLVHNNTASVTAWPNSGGAYNPTGSIINCTFACNYGSQYAGLHSDGVCINTITWNNLPEEGFGDPANYVADTSRLSGKNASDDGFAYAYSAMKLSRQNMDAKGPQFKAPTHFVGIPVSDADIAAMRAADFSLMSTSKLIDLGQAKGSTTEDIEGTKRPLGKGVDVGAFEYNPSAPTVKVSGVAITLDTLRIVEEQQAWLAAVITPKNASDKQITWAVADKKIATVSDEGQVTGVSIGKTTITVTTRDGNKKASCVVVVDAKPVVIIHHEVLAADTLYPMANYTVPSFIPFWAAKEAARADSTEENLQAMRDAIPTLVGKEYPYCVVANINGDPTTQMAFAWFTNEGQNDGKVQLVAQADATDTDFKNALEFAATPTTTKPLRYAVSLSGIIKATGMPTKTAYRYVSHKALATGLKPNTTYSYRVGTDNAWSDIRTFTTAPAEKESFSFLYMTDSHLQDEEYVSKAEQCALTAAKYSSDARFLLFPGDFVETGTADNSEWEWERWFERSMRPMLEMMPCVPTDGNHDDSPNLNYTYHFNTNNDFKSNAKIKPQFDGTTYSFVYGDVLFLVYSHQDYWKGSYNILSGQSVYLQNDVAQWMRREVAKHPNTKWRVALVHKNLFCGSGHQIDEESQLFRTILMPVFKELHVDMVLQGHDHTYEVIGPVNPEDKTPLLADISGVRTVEQDASTNMTGKEGGVFRTDNGTMYFVGATCGRKRYYPYSKEEMEANYDKTKVANYYDLFTGKFGQPGAPAYTEITVNADSMVVSTYKTSVFKTRQLYDEIVIKREADNTYLDVHTLPAETQNDVFKTLYKGQLLIAKGQDFYDILGRKYSREELEH